MKHKSHVHGSDTFHAFSLGTKEVIPVKQMVILFAVAIVAGTLLGFGITRFTNASPTTQSGEAVSQGKDGETTDAPDSAGIVDKEEFPDEAEGTLTKGGIEGEGTHHLQRSGGESQNVYLTSSAVDLSLFEGKDVKVMGKTYDSEKAGWLMDVGYIERK